MNNSSALSGSFTINRATVASRESCTLRPITSLSRRLSRLESEEKAPTRFGIITENCRTKSRRLLTSSLVVIRRDEMIIRIFAFVQSTSRAESPPVTEDYLNRFGGIARLYGLAALERFSNAHVMVIGLGGVGSWTVEALARSGVGQFTLVDLDDL